MIHDVDASLRNFIDADVIAGGGVEVAFDAPTKDWTARQNSPIVNVFLYDIREDLSRRDTAPIQVRNDEGRVVDRVPAPRRFKLSYLVTAWTQRPEDEHRILAELLTTFLRHEAIPEDHLTGELEETPVPVLFDVALPPTQDRSLSDIWTALGGELKPSLDLQVIAPALADRHFGTGPPVRERPRLVFGPDGLIEPPHVPEQDDDLEVVRRAPGAPLEDEPGGERVQAGVDDEPGRTLEIRPHVPHRGRSATTPNS